MPTLIVAPLPSPRPIIPCAFPVATLIVPVTCKFEYGEVVPIPTRPALSMVNLTLLFDANWQLLAPAEPNTAAYALEPTNNPPPVLCSTPIDALCAAELVVKS